MNLYPGSPGDPKFLILAPTGVTAIIINGAIINSGVTVPPYLNEFTLPSLSIQKKEDYALCILI